MQVDETAAAEMSRAEALRALATGDGVPERDRRMAEIMLAGPDINNADEAWMRACPRSYRPRRNQMATAVALALLQYRAEVQDERAAMHAEMRELAGGRL